MNIKFHYYGDYSIAHTNVITIATLKVDNILKVGITCSNKADHYLRNEGRAIAKARLEDNPILLEWNAGKFTWHDAKQIVGDYVIANKSLFPSWAAALVKEELHLDKMYYRINNKINDRKYRVTVDAEIGDSGMTYSAILTYHEVESIQPLLSIMKASRINSFPNSFCDKYKNAFDILAEIIEYESDSEAELNYVTVIEMSHIVELL